MRREIYSVGSTLGVTARQPALIPPFWGRPTYHAMRFVELEAFRVLGPDRPPSTRSGRAMARSGLRMMPTFPWPSLKFRTAGFPQYGFKAGISDWACPFDAACTSRGLLGPSRSPLHTSD